MGFKCMWQAEFEKLVGNLWVVFLLFIIDDVTVPILSSLQYSCQDVQLGELYHGITTNVCQSRKRCPRSISAITSDRLWWFGYCMACLGSAVRTPSPAQFYSVMNQFAIGSPAILA
jgi:hypothetical protein